MIIDSSLQFCNAVSVARAAGTALIGSQVDQTAAGTLDATGLYFVLVVTTDIITGGSAGTVQFKLSSDTTAAVSTTTALDEIITPVFVTGTTAITAGTLLYSGELPKDLGTYTPSRRFLGVLQVTGTTTITAGAVSAFLTLEAGKWAPTATVNN